VKGAGCREEGVVGGEDGAVVGMSGEGDEGRGGRGTVSCARRRTRAAEEKAMYVRMVARRVATLARAAGAARSVARRAEVEGRMLEGRAGSERRWVGVK
jgi:hypothetical protein